MPCDNAPHSETCVQTEGDYTMGDKGGKKDKNKSQKQKQNKQEKVKKKQQDKQQKKTA